MRQSRYQAWFMQIAAVALYATAYGALCSVSFSHWFLPAGLRVLCLFFVPRRYWAALAVGEALPLARISYECFETFGLAYALLKLIPPILFCMPIVHWCRTRLGMLDSKAAVRMSAFILCALLASVVTAARDVIFLFASPAETGVPDSSWASSYFIGNFLGILTIVPAVLALRANYRKETWRELWTRLSSSRLTLEFVSILVPLLALLCYLATTAPGTPGQAARIAMFLPVAMLAMRHGWQGAAFGGFAASIAIAISTPVVRDPATIEAEIYMACAISTLLLLGGRITSLNAKDVDERKQGQLALQAAQQGMFVSELRMQQAADTIEQISATVHHMHAQLFDRMRYIMTPSEERSYSKQLVASRFEAFKLANGLSPRVLQKRGLPDALQGASLAFAFERDNIEFTCEFAGGNPGDLRDGAQFALYRLVSEACALLYEQATLARVHLVVRTGTSRGRRWVVARLDGWHAVGVQDVMPSMTACEQFRKQVGATGLGVGAMRDQAFVYGGMVHLRSIAQRTRLALLLHDATTAVPIRAS